MTSSYVNSILRYFSNSYPKAQLSLTCRERVVVGVGNPKLKFGLASELGQKQGDPYLAIINERRPVPTNPDHPLQWRDRVHVPSRNHSLLRTFRESATNSNSIRCCSCGEHRIVGWFYTFWQDCRYKSDVTARACRIFRD
jgi:hypothetical protein